MHTLVVELMLSDSNVRTYIRKSLSTLDARHLGLCMYVVGLVRCVCMYVLMQILMFIRTYVHTAVTVHEVRNCVYVCTYFLQETVR